MRAGKIEIHRFFCPRCGEETIPLARSSGKRRERFHLKKLYCFRCNMTLNMVECRDEEEVKLFKEAFKTGELSSIVDASEIIDWSEVNESN